MHAQIITIYLNQQHHHHQTTKPQLHEQGRKEEKKERPVWKYDFANIKRQPKNCCDSEEPHSPQRVEPLTFMELSGLKASRLSTLVMLMVSSSGLRLRFL